MAFLNTEARVALVNELKVLPFNRAKGKVRGMDPKSRLVYFRNSQGVDRWMTRFDLPTLGTRVTLVESNQVKDKKGVLKSEYEMVEVVVEALPGNDS
jgi:hypothetical protein